MGLFSSKSSSSSLTTNTDARVVGGDDSINSSLNVGGSNNAITTTDHGAVSGSLRLALAGVEGANKTTEQAIASSGGLLEGALRNSGQQAQAFTDTIKDIKTSDVRVLVIAGLAVVGLGAAFVFKGNL